jgi:hypothetical protein
MQPQAEQRDPGRRARPGRDCWASRASPCWTTASCASWITWATTRAVVQAARVSYGDGTKAV